MIFYCSFLCIIRSLVWRPLLLDWYTYLLRGQLKDSSGCWSFSLYWRPIGGFQLLSALWSGCCLFDTLPMFILNFIYFVPFVIFIGLNRQINIQICNFIILLWIQLTYLVQCLNNTAIPCKIVSQTTVNCRALIRY